MIPGSLVEWNWFYFLSLFLSLPPYSSSYTHPPPFFVVSIDFSLLLFFLFPKLTIFGSFFFLARVVHIRTTSSAHCIHLHGHKVHRVKRNERRGIIRTPKCNTLTTNGSSVRDLFYFVHIFFFSLFCLFFFNFSNGSTLTTLSYKSKNVRSKQQGRCRISGCLRSGSDTRRADDRYR